MDKGSYKVHVEPVSRWITVGDDPRYFVRAVLAVELRDIEPVLYHDLGKARLLEAFRTACHPSLLVG